MKKTGILLLLLALVLGALPGTAAADSAVTRIKDISKVQGVRSNQLMGYGLVVGLDGTGDGSSSGETVQSIANMLTSYGITVNTSSIKLKNVAAVMVTATLPPFVREGDSLDVTVSSIGDAKSLRGGTLLTGRHRSAPEMARSMSLHRAVSLRAALRQEAAEAARQRHSRPLALPSMAALLSARWRMTASARTARFRCRLRVLILQLLRAWRGPSMRSTGVLHRRAIPAAWMWRSRLTSAAT